MRAGRYGIVADPFVTRRPCAFAMIASDLSHSARPPALLALAGFRCPFRVVAVGHSPVVTRPADGGVTANFAYASASCARDRPAASNQSPHAKNYERDPFNTTGPTCRGSVTCGASAPNVHASTSSVGRLS
jgi:hypothetical protein